MRLLACSSSIHSTSAERKTSAGAPFSIWRASAELAANENLTGIDVSFVKPSPSSCSALVNEAAANTVIGGLSASAATLVEPNHVSHSINPTPTNFSMIEPHCATVICRRLQGLRAAHLMRATHLIGTRRVMLIGILRLCQVPQNVLWTRSPGCGGSA